MSDDHFLARWSRRKLEARKAPEEGGAPPAEAITPAPSVVAPSREAAVPAKDAVQPSPAEPAAALPPVESLTPSSDFTPFMKADVDPDVKRAALKTLFADPRHNVMDGLDVYIDDYSKPDPLPEGWLEQLRQTARLGDYQPPPEVVPEEEPELLAGPEDHIQEQGLDTETDSPPNGAEAVPSPPPESKES